MARMAVQGVWARDGILLGFRDGSKKAESFFVEDRPFALRWCKCPGEPGDDSTASLRLFFRRDGRYPSLPPLVVAFLAAEETSGASVCFRREIGFL